jgi:transcriptional regulator with XRE-family HTH domain
MQKRLVQRGRPKGSTTYEAGPAIAFGQAIRMTRLDQGVSQEALAHLAGVERSHMGKVERGEHLPNLGLIFKLATALNTAPGVLVNLTESLLKAAGSKEQTDGEARK